MPKAKLRHEDLDSPKLLLQLLPPEPDGQDLDSFHRTICAISTHCSIEAAWATMFPYCCVLAACVCSCTVAPSPVRTTSAAVEERNSLRAEETMVKHRVQIGTHRTSQ